jgi:hypothetical protein
MKINLTKLRERATKCAESMPGPWHTGHISEFDNTQEVAAANGISIGEIELPEAHSHIVACDPNTVIGLIDEIERLRGALEFYGDKKANFVGPAVIQKAVFATDMGLRARNALAAHRERFEE